MVADEHDRFHARLRTFIDLEDDIDAAIGEIDDSIGDGCCGFTGATVKVLDTLDVGIDNRRVEGTVCFRLDFGLQLVALDLAVALEGDAVDQLVFLDADDDAAAFVQDLYVRE